MAFELVKKPIQYCDLETRQLKRKSVVTKNELMREMIETCIRNEFKFHFVLMDSWFSATENFDFIAGKGRHFIAALKDNRLFAVKEKGKTNKRFVRVQELNLPENTVVRGWLKGYAKEVLVLRQVFTNKDGSTGILHLVCSDLTCDYDTITTTYKKRGVVAWIEHRSSFPFSRQIYAAMFRRRTEFGRPASSMRLRTATPTTASACWPEKLRP